MFQNAINGHKLNIELKQWENLKHFPDEVLCNMSLSSLFIVLAAVIEEAIVLSEKTKKLNWNNIILVHFWNFLIEK